VHPTGGSLRVFRQFAWLGAGSVKAALPRPTHQRVTLTVSPQIIIKAPLKKTGAHNGNLEALMNEQRQTKAVIRAACITGIFTCVGATMAAVICLVIISLGFLSIQKLANLSEGIAKQPAEGCSIAEHLTVPFTGSYNATYTQYSYKGKVFVIVSGTGQSAGTQYTDAFYLFADDDGRSINPEHPTDWILTINGDLANYLIPNGEIPPYRSEHIYNFEIIVPDGNLSFGVSDGFASDNTGSYAITLCQP
jgi:hypothetical protein